MSDFEKIVESRKAKRINASTIERQVGAAEDTADALEAIRQDIAGISRLLALLTQAVGDIQGRLKR